MRHYPELMASDPGLSEASDTARKLIERTPKLTEDAWNGMSGGSRTHTFRDACMPGGLP